MWLGLKGKKQENGRVKPIQVKRGDGKGTRVSEPVPGERSRGNGHWVHRVNRVGWSMHGDRHKVCASHKH